VLPLSYGSGLHLPAEVNSGAAMCPTALDHTSPLRWALALALVLWLRTSPPGRGGLWCCHVSYGSGPRLPIEVGSGTAMCPVASYGL
jgi:hypothetical protein